MFIARFPNLSIAIALPNLNIGIARLSSAILFSYSSSVPRYGKDLELQMFLQRLFGNLQFQDRRSMGLYEADDDTPRIINTGPRPGKYRYRRSLPDVPPHVEYDSDKFENEKEDYDIDNILDKDNEKNSDERTVPMPRLALSLFHI
jgi:hypothetical protein